MRSLYLISLLYFVSASCAFAQFGFSNENSLSSSELVALQSELKAVEKVNNEKYKNGPQSFTELYASLIAKMFGTNVSSNLPKEKVEQLKPEIVSDGSEIYSQKIFFRYTASQTRFKQKLIEQRRIALRRAYLRKQRGTINNDFAKDLDYSL